MSGFVRELIDRREAIKEISESLGFPWYLNKEKIQLNKANGRILAEDLQAWEDHPSFTRSLRDGYAVKSSDITGASEGSPSYLRLVGSIPMGTAPERELLTGEAIQIHTGGMLPEGSDCIVMLEDTSLAGSWLEIRKALQSGANVIRKGEEIRKGQVVLTRGQYLDFRTTGIMAHMGNKEIQVAKPRIGIISTGDEIVPIEEKNIPSGSIRDVNMEVLHVLFQKYGFKINRYGILKDNKKEIYDRASEAMHENDIVLVSGGSSVSARDYTYEVFEDLVGKEPFLRGLRIKPGKPTLFSASEDKQKLLFGMPGHPLSCSVVAFVFVIPVILNSISAGSWEQKIHFFELAGDVYGNTGIEEFIPFRFSDGNILPVMSKSGYIGSLVDSDGLIVLDEHTETARKGETVGVMLWK